MKDDTPLTPVQVKIKGKGGKKMKKLVMGLVVLSGLIFGFNSPAADFDGDGNGDVAVFRASSGLWSVRGVTRIYFGSTGDTPVPGDYDGLGRDSAAIFRPAAGLWAVRDVTRVYFGSGSDEAKPGDYNGDGVYDFAIFRPSSALWAVKDITRFYYGTSTDTAISPGKTRDGLIQTGQTTSYRTGDDGYYEVGSPFRYEILYSPPSDWVIADHRTDLMWPRYASSAGGAFWQQTDWNSAIDYCNNLDFAGYDDWRLPNVRELQSIVDYGETNPAIDTSYFFNIMSGADYYWTSTTSDYFIPYAWIVGFRYGTVDYVMLKTNTNYLLAVRGGR